MRRPWLLIVFALALASGVGVSRSLRGQPEGGPAPNPPVRLDADLTAVRVLLGRGDTAPTPWDGTLSVSDGTLVQLKGWRFRQQDQITGPTSWKASSRRQQAAAGAINPNPPMIANGVVAVLKAGPGTLVSVTTPRGEFQFQPLSLAADGQTPFLNGAAAVEMVPADLQVSAAATEDDFPSAAVAPDGTVWVAYLSYRYADAPAGTAPHLRPMQQEPQSFDFLRPAGNGDQLRLARISQDGSGAVWTDVASCTAPQQDLYRPAVAVDSEGKPWVVWSQNVSGNWDLYARRYGTGGLSPTMRLTHDAGPDLHAAVARDSRGSLWLAWQAFRGGTSDILVSSLEPGGNRWSEPARVSTGERNDWDPVLTSDSMGSVYVAWDTYDRGSYDVLMRRISDGHLEPVIPIAETRRFEARPSLVCDTSDRVWVAWEEAPERWGKDFGFWVQDQGIPLFRGHTVSVRCFTGGKPYMTAGKLEEAFPNPQGGRARPNPTLGQAARQGAATQESFPRLGLDGAGRVYLAFRRALQPQQSPTGTTWFSFITTYEGRAWTPAELLPLSDGLLDNRPALVPARKGSRLLLVHASDGRNHAGSSNPRFQMYVAAFSGSPLPHRAAQPVLAPAPLPESARNAPAGDPLVVSERADLARIRGFRTTAGGRTYRLLRGEFHRHTEISGDGGGDGPLVDLWRYALDAAAMDWIGNGDHDNGGGREYTWWQIQKATDAYHLGERFNPMFTYERSVNYPDGHRNVMFARRGIRTLPRLQAAQAPGVAPGDTKMLYRYLHNFDGICASHTSATNMGTDWRDNDPKVEPVVEIYQGDRQNYEYLGAPRSGTEQNSPGGFRPAGFVWNALEKQYRLGFQSSSDHISTHISYAILYAEGASREAVLDAFKKRHSYGATDNIILEVRSGQHMMGDEFETRKAPRLRIRATATGLVARVVVVKDNRVVYTAAPRQPKVDLSWMDADAKAGTSYYYVRLEQEDGQLAWASPMWIHYRP